MPVNTALIIDDDATSRDHAKQILSALGVANIHMAINGKDAAEQIDTLEALDLVMCDIIMPEKDGIEFISDLVRVGYTGGLILMSFNGAQFMDLTRLIAKRKNLQIWATLNKPLIQDEVASAIATGLANQPG